MLKEYLTVSGPASAEYIERKSRFIASVAPVSSENEAIEFLDKVRSKYWEARHNAYAYKIVGDSVAQRFSDDGEPSGTAGLPVVEVINKSGVINLVVVVTRYFGGILLGASGLVRAYGKTASMGIEAAGIIKKCQCDISCVKLQYPMLGKVRNSLEDSGYKIDNVEYGQDVALTVAVRTDSREMFMRLLDDTTGAQAKIEWIGRKYVTCPPAWQD